MSPRSITFNPETVLRASFAVVRQQGWEALTARSVATSLGASVAPVYSAFGSMEKLSRETLIKIRGLLLDYTSRSYSELPFLNMGVGIVSFARDEPYFFQALFQKRHPFQDVVEEVNDSILSWMKTDSKLGLLSEEQRRRLYDHIGFFTMGLAAAVAAGRIADVSNRSIVRRLKSMGNSLMFAEIAGVADAESPESKKGWNRLLKEKNFSLPKAEKAGGPRKVKKETK